MNQFVILIANRVPHQLVGDNILSLTNVLSLTIFSLTNDLISLLPKWAGGSCTGEQKWLA